MCLEALDTADALHDALKKQGARFRGLQFGHKCIAITYQELVARQRKALADKDAEIERLRARVTFCQQLIGTLNERITIARRWMRKIDTGVLRTLGEECTDFQEPGDARRSDCEEE